MQTPEAGRFSASLLTILLASCAALPPEDTGPTQRERRDLYEARADRLQAMPGWLLEGRLAVSDGEDGGSGRLEWREQPGRSDLDFRGALGKGAWRLHITPDLAVLSFGSGESWTADDVSELVRGHLGWNIPVESLSWWVRGLQAPGRVSQRELDEEGRMSRLDQHGWNVEYQRYKSYSGLSLPTRVEARNGARHVKLVMRDWAFPGHSGDGS